MAEQGDVDGDLYLTPHLTIKMKKQQVEKLMFKAFKEGQKRYEAEDYPIKLWIAEELN